MNLPQEIIQEIIEYICIIPLEWRIVSYDWKCVCETHILNQIKKAFDFDTNGIYLELTNAKELEGVDIKNTTSAEYNYLNQTLCSTNIGRFFNISTDAHDQNNAQSKIKLRYTNIQTKSHECILELLKNEKMDFIEKFKKINVLFFQNIFNACNMNYYMDHPDASMFDFTFLFLGEHKDTLQLKLHHYDMKNKKKREHMQNFLDFHHQSKNIICDIVNPYALNIKKFETNYSIKFRYTFDDDSIKWSISDTLSEEDQRVYESYDDLVRKYERQPSKVFSRDKLSVASDLQIGLNASLVDCNILLMNQIQPLKNMCCFSDTFLKSHGNIIRFFKQ